ncbi:type II toxin-antitoxin system Phd/YefM family antitoxin [Chloroflexota bacterium]
MISKGVMMPDIGVRELKTHTSEIVRNVREQRTRYVITYRGRPVGLLLPFDEADTADLSFTAASASTAWEELTQLGEEIAEGWRSSLTSTEILSNMRR